MSPRTAFVCWLVLAAAGWGMVLAPTWVAVEHGPAVVAWIFETLPSSEDGADPARMYADEVPALDAEEAADIQPAAGAD